MRIESDETMLLSFERYMSRPRTVDELHAAYARGDLSQIELEVAIERVIETEQEDQS